jgi:hypothetical protein
MIYIHVLNGGGRGLTAQRICDSRIGARHNPADR